MYASSQFAAIIKQTSQHVESCDSTRDETRFPADAFSRGGKTRDAIKTESPSRLSLDQHLKLGARAA